MSLSAIVDAMVAAGCSGEQIAAAVRAHEASMRAKSDAALEKKRADAAERQRRFRAARNVSNALQSVTGVTQKENSPTPPIRKTTSLTNVRETLSAREASLDRLREAYPRRCGGDPKQSALKALDRALRDGAELDAIVAGARAFAASRAGEDPKFTPMLATWLNRKGWLDDYTSPPSRAGPQAQRSILSRIATGEYFDEPTDQRNASSATCGTDPAGARTVGPVSERPGEDRDGPLLDFRPTGTGWR